MTPPAPAGWVATDATVTSCGYQFRALSALAFGFQRGERFRITFRYAVGGQHYTGEFQSAKAIPQNEHISIAYDPVHPSQNTRDRSSGRAPTTGVPLLAVAISGSVLLSLVWLVILRGCR